MEVSDKMALVTDTSDQAQIQAQAFKRLTFKLQASSLKASQNEMLV